jgi:hypothetical protein
MATDVFVRDVVARHTWRVSGATGGQTAGGSAHPDSSEPALDRDGHVLAFASDAANIVTGDSNNATDVFLRTR